MKNQMNPEIIYWMIDFCSNNCNWPHFTRFLSARGFTPEEIASTCNAIAEKAGYSDQFSADDFDLDGAGGIY